MFNAYTVLYIIFIRSQGHSKNQQLTRQTDRKKKNTVKTLHTIQDNFYQTMTIIAFNPYADKG